MARPAKDWRPAIAEAALAAFTARGYRQTQVADVARRLRIAVGTIYTQVAGKQALFDLAMRRALDLPLAGDEAAVQLLRRELTGGAHYPLLTAALARRRPVQAKAEIAGILGELYDLLAARRRLISLLDRCAWELPELAELYATRVKGGYIADLTAYVARRTHQGILAAPAPPEATARAAMEAVVWMAMHRHNDAMPPTIDEATARTSVVAMLTRGLLR
jgi:AcrR family transcriptional regulator